MIAGHPSEIELQRYAMEEAGCTTEVIGHIEQCERCRTSISTYRLLLAGMKQQPRPVFEFEVAELILAQLPASAPAPPIGLTPPIRPLSPAAPAAARKDLVLYILVFGVFALIGLPFYFFRQDLSKMLTGMLPVAVGLITMTVFLVSLFYGIEMYRKYRKQLNALNY